MFEESFLGPMQDGVLNGKNIKIEELLSLKNVSTHERWIIKLAIKHSPALRESLTAGEIRFKDLANFCVGNAQASLYEDDAWSKQYVALLNIIDKENLPRLLSLNPEQTKQVVEACTSNKLNAIKEGKLQLEELLSTTPRSKLGKP
jgi:hypothetical protein